MPGMTQKLLKAHTPKSEATIKGHMDANRKNQRSTKTLPSPEEENKHLEELFQDFFPTQPADGKRTHHVFLSTLHVQGQIHTDLTGRFPVPSSTGNHYLLIAYDYDSNAILLQPVKNRKGPTLLEAYKVIQA